MKKLNRQDQETPYPVKSIRGSSHTTKSHSIVEGRELPFDHVRHPRPHLPVVCRYGRPPTLVVGTGPAERQQTRKGEPIHKCRRPGNQQRHGPTLRLQPHLPKARRSMVQSVGNRTFPQSVSISILRT